MNCADSILDTVFELCWQCLRVDLRAFAISVPQVCELDIIFNFEKAFFMLDEFMLGGEVQETSKKNVLKAIAAQDLMQEVSCLPSCIATYLPLCCLFPPQLDDHNIDLLLCNVVLCFWPYLPLCTGPLASLCGVFLLADLTSLCGVFFLADLTSLCGVFLLADRTPFVVCSSQLILPPIVVCSS